MYLKFIYHDVVCLPRPKTSLARKILQITLAYTNHVYGQRCENNALAEKILAADQNSASGDSIWIWDAKATRPVRTLQGHKDIIHEIERFRISLSVKQRGFVGLCLRKGLYHSLPNRSNSG